MITYKDQEELFTLISKRLRRDVTCYAFGGNAMMYYGYKEETKDVDVVFETEEERTEFCRVLRELGYTETSAITIYVPEKLRDKSKPIVMKRDEGRFDLFVKKIFKTVLSQSMKENLFATHEFRGDGVFIVNVLRKEHLVLLKGITDRKNDFDDIRTIMEKEKDFDWEFLIKEIGWQFEHGDSWVLLDMERTMQELKKVTFIPEKWFKELYKIGKGKT